MHVAIDAAMNKGFQPQMRMLRTLQPPSPARNIAGLALVVALHVAVLLGALYGLNHGGVRIVPPAALEWVSIVTPMPPPPARQKIELAKASQPVPVAVTPPVLVIDQVPQSSEAISVPTSDVASGSASSMNTNAVAPSAGLASACPNAQAIRATMRYPALARRDGVEGNVLARFVVGAGGGIRNIEIVASANRVFNSAVIDAVKQFSCIGQGQDVTVEVPFIFHLE